MASINTGPDGGAGMSIGEDIGYGDYIFATVRVKSIPLTVDDPDDIGLVVLDYRQEYHVSGDEFASTVYLNAEDAFNHILRGNMYMLLGQSSHEAYIQRDHQRLTQSDSQCLAVFCRPFLQSKSEIDSLISMKSQTAIATITKWQRTLVDPKTFYLVSGLGAKKHLGETVNNGIMFSCCEEAKQVILPHRVQIHDPGYFMRQLLVRHYATLPLGHYSYQRVLVTITRIDYVSVAELLCATSKCL
jgi:hypothetical protein